MALLCVFSLRVLALVIVRFRLVSSARKVSSLGAAVHGPGGILPLPIGSMLIPLPGGRPTAVNWSRGTVRQAALGSSKCVKYRVLWGISASQQLRRL